MNTEPKPGLYLDSGEFIPAQEITTPQPTERKRLTSIMLPDGAELRHVLPYGWRLYRGDSDIRLLDYWEQTFIDSAIRAALGIT